MENWLICWEGIARQSYLQLPHLCQNCHLCTKNKIFYTTARTVNVVIFLVFPNFLPGQPRSDISQNLCPARQCTHAAGCSMRTLCSWAKNLGNITSRLNIAVAKFSLTDAILTYFVTFPKDKDGFLHVFFLHFVQSFTNRIRCST